MKYYKGIRKAYDLTKQDSDNVTSLRPVMLRYRDEFVENFNETLKKRFSINEELAATMIDMHAKFLGEWYERFLEGNMSNDYISFLTRSGTAHIKNAIDPEIINGMQSFMRVWFHEKIFQNVEDDVHRKNILISIHKFMDATDDIIMDAYYSEQYCKGNASFSLRRMTVGVSESFSNFMHIILVSILILLTIGATVFFGFDTWALAKEHGSHMLISALGSLLIIWVLVELLHTEIQVLRGGKFRTSVFIGVALIAFIRDLLIITLKHEQNFNTTVVVLVSIMVLGIIYWLVSRTEKADTPQRR